MFRKFNTLFTILIGAAILLSACSNGETTTNPTQAPASQVPQTSAEEPTQATGEPGDPGTLPDVDPGLVNGKVVIAGSSTVYPLTERMAERFVEEGFSGQITVDSIGSGAGFERFCKTGETDVAAASRAIKEEEVANCAAIARTPIEFRVGTDALAIVISRENEFLTGVTTAELAQIFSSDVVTWSDVNPAWPNEDILRFSPGTDSGTFDYFVESVMQSAYGKEGDTARNSILNAANIQFSEDDNVLVQGVEGSPYAIGYFGFAYYIENQGALKALNVDGVSPSEKTAESGDYTLARPLFLYSDAQIIQDKPQIAAFLNFYLTYVNEEILGVGYFRASDEALESAKQALLDAIS